MTAAGEPSLPESEQWIMMKCQTPRILDEAETVERAGERISQQMEAGHRVALQKSFRAKMIVVRRGMGDSP